MEINPKELYKKIQKLILILLRIMAQKINRKLNNYKTRLSN